MIKHIVLVQFSDEVSTAQREAIYESVESLKQYVTGWEGCSIVHIILRDL